MRLATFLSIHDVQTIKARSISEVPGLLNIALDAGDWKGGVLELSLFTSDRVLSERLAAAINTVVEERKAERATVATAERELVA